MRTPSIIQFSIEKVAVVQNKELGMIDVKNKKCKGVQCKDPDTNEMITKCPFEQHGNYRG